MVLYVSLLQPTLILCLSLSIICCVEYQTAAILCTAFVASGKEKQNLCFDAFPCLSFKQKLQDPCLTLHRFCFYLVYCFFVFYLVGQFFL